MTFVFQGILTLHNKTTAAIMFASSRIALEMALALYAIHYSFSQLSDNYSAGGLLHKMNASTTRLYIPRCRKRALKSEQKDGHESPERRQNGNGIRDSDLVSAFCYSY